jgi:hypothetical protein
MKKIIILALAIILFPNLSIGQRTDAHSEVVSVKKFFDKYSEYPGYECLEIREQMFKQFLKEDDLDQEFINFLSSLKFVRYLEYTGRGPISITSGVAGVSSRNYPKGGNIYYVDGVRVRGGVSAKEVNKDSLKVVSGTLSQDKKAAQNVLSTGSAAGKVAANTSPQATGVNINQISNRNNMLYQRAKDEIDLRLFSQLMKSSKDGEKLLFLKREAGGGYSEYLLLTGNTMINIMGDLDISHIDQIEEILDAVGDILPL